MAKIPYKEGADFPELPTKTPILCKIIESEFIEDDPNPWFGKETGKFDKKGAPIIDQKEFRNLVKVIFQAVEDTDAYWAHNDKNLSETAGHEADPDSAATETVEVD